MLYCPCDLLPGRDASLQPIEVGGVEAEEDLPLAGDFQTSQVQPFVR